MAAEPESPQPAPASPRKRARPRWGVEVLVLLPVLALLGTATWLAASEAGLRTLAAWAENLSGGRLALEPAGGNLVAGPRFARLTYDDGDFRLALHELVLDWKLATLAGGRLERT